ncbi:hypothetical protein QTO34_012282 [Cnephaeus nilssonii]|uniref:Dynein light chain 1, cytoplasmic n=5 Tax=Boreoeutheria TaxID=1437010 RepID=A0AA40HD91_CNENI|nr:hypothetical protein QTO34_012282 [Eptesicus nilssonii]
MCDRKAVIKNADMSEEMQQDSVECATQALEKYNIEKDIAAHIKKVRRGRGAGARADGAQLAGVTTSCPGHASPERLAEIHEGTQGSLGVEFSRKNASEFGAPLGKTRTSAPQVFFIIQLRGGKRHLATVSKIREQRCPPSARFLRGRSIWVFGRGELRGRIQQPGGRSCQPSSGEFGRQMKEFDKKYNPTWHCIVGRNFGSYVTHETKHFIYFYLGQRQHHRPDAHKVTLSFPKWDTGPASSPERQPTKSQPTCQDPMAQNAAHSPETVAVGTAVLMCNMGKQYPPPRSRNENRKCLHGA